MKEIKFLDLFGGIGGFRFGLEQASDSFQCVGYIEKDKHAVQSYNQLFNENHEPIDVNELDKEDIPDHDVLCGGFPCQPFSDAGKQLGMNDERGTLFYEALSIVKEKRPKIIFLENVKGFISQSGGNAIEELITSMNRLGYSADFRVINSKDFGVAQNRRRMFIIGYDVFQLSEELQESVLVEETINNIENGRKPDIEDIVMPKMKELEVLDELDIDTRYKPKKKQRKLFGNPVETDNVGKDMIEWFKEEEKLNRKNFEPEEFQFYVYGLIWMNREKWKEKLENIRRNLTKAKVKTEYDRGRNEKKDSKSRSFRSKFYSLGLGTGKPNIPERSFGGRSRSEILLEPGETQDIIPEDESEQRPVGINIHTSQGEKKVEIARTIDKNYHKGIDNYGQRTHVLTDNGIRRLTPKECWRLQGFPEEKFSEIQSHMSDTQIYRQVGNAVTVPVIKELGKNIEEVLNK